MSKRIQDRPRRSAAAFFALVTILTFPILEIGVRGERARQFVHDVFDGDLPGRVAVRDDWVTYGPSLWNTHLTGGNASLAQFALPPTTPDFLLSFVIPQFAAYALTYMALIWVAGFGMYLFLRESMRLARGASLIGGIFYAFSFWHFIHGFAIPLLPTMLWLTDRWADADRARWKYTVAMVAIATFGLYAGLLQLQVLVVGIQGTYLVLTRWGSGQLRRLFAQYLGIWVTAILLFAPVLATQLVYLNGSQRAIWDLGYLYDSTLPSAITTSASLFASVIVGVPIPGVAPGTGGYSGTFFLGGIGLMALLAGLAAGRRDARRGFMLGLLVAIPVAYLIALLMVPIQGRIPIINSFQFIRVSHLFPLALCVNAAIGFDLLLSPRRREVTRRRVLSSASVVVLVLLGGEGVYAIAQSIFERSSNWALAAAAILGGACAAAALLWICRTGASRKTTGSVVLAGLMLLVVGERMAFVRAERVLNPGLGTYAGTMSVTPAMAYVAAQPDRRLDRTITAGEHANRMLVAGLSEAGGYQSIYRLDYHRFFGALTDPYLQTDPDKYEYFHGWGNRAYVFGPGLDPELLDLVGVRWVYAKDMTFDEPGLEAVFSGGGVTVYENAGVFPRSFVVGNVRTFSTDALLAEGLAAADRETLLSTAFIIAGAVPDGLPTTLADGASSSIVDYAPDRVEIRTSTSSGGLLLLTDTAAPGWTATVNGSEASILTADLAFRAVVVPKGEASVVFTYRPWFTYMGLAAAAAALLGLFVFASMSWWSARRSTPRISRR